MSEDLEGYSDKIVWDTLKNMEFLLGKELFKTKPEGVRRRVGINDRGLSVGIVDLRDAVEGYSKDEFMNSLLRCWAEQARPNVEHGVRAFHERCPGVQRVVWYTHPWSKGFFWDVETRGGNTKAWFNLPSQKAEASVGPSSSYLHVGAYPQPRPSGRPPVAVGKILEDHWAVHNSHTDLYYTRSGKR